jgi:hypothetical protein
VKDKIALYSLGIGIFALGGTIFNHLAYAKPISLERPPLILIIAPLFGYLIWLRWDWAPAARCRELEQQRREKDDT